MPSEQNIAEDLLNLEINAILVSGISSRKMPGAREVLQEIAEKYAFFLQRTADRTQSALENAALPHLASKIDMTPLKVRDQEPNTHMFQNMVGTRADELLDIRDQAREEGLTFDREITNVLRRVNKNCKTLGDLLEANPSLKLTPSELLRVRKIWEIGTERVLMQTVVQLDGDIVTRIQIGRETAKDKALHDMHKELVNLAIGNWQFMVQTLTNLIKSGLGSLFKR